jgi:pimeloyl-ACP methyl ester carboxylesterase
VEGGKPQFDFSFHASLPAPTNRWTSVPKGTVVLLHGYGLAQFAMAPWALRLAQDGWRCVLVDLRGHGKSTGARIYFGVREASDLSQLLDELALRGKLVRPVCALGESYGASLALRWRETDPRVRNVVAITPYAELGPAVLNIRQEYAPWVPVFIVKAALKRLPSVLQVPPDELDTTTLLSRQRVSALFVAGSNDLITPAAEVERLCRLAAPDSRVIVVPRATHESVTYFFDDLVPPVLDWLARTNQQPATAMKSALKNGID